MQDGSVGSICTGMSWGIGQGPKAEQYELAMNGDEGNQDGAESDEVVEEMG